MSVLPTHFETERTFLIFDCTKEPRGLPDKLIKTCRNTNIPNIEINASIQNITLNTGIELLRALQLPAKL
jgi:hypothetical protein